MRIPVIAITTMKSIFTGSSGVCGVFEVAGAAWDWLGPDDAAGWNPKADAMLGKELPCRTIAQVEEFPKC
jgi:hypothetical protein